MNLPDEICRCVNKTCPLRCQRKRAGDPEYQSYTSFAPEKPNKYETCKGYIPEEDK